MSARGFANGGKGCANGGKGFANGAKGFANGGKGVLLMVARWFCYWRPCSRCRGMRLWMMDGQQGFANRGYAADAGAWDFNGWYPAGLLCLIVSSVAL